MRRILFLCTGNCVRSQMAEAILNYRGVGRFEARSAGSRPAGFVHPMALQTLSEIGAPVRDLRSKSWREFEREPFDAIITLCGSARDEICPVWTLLPEDKGGPVRAHWGFEDPSRAEVMGVEARLNEFRAVRDEIRECVELLATTPERILKDSRRFTELIRSIERSLAEDVLE